MCSLDKIFFLVIIFIMLISDIKTKSIPVFLAGLNIIIGIVSSIINKNNFLTYIIFVIFTLVFLTISKLSKEKIGYGDSILLGSLFLFFSLYDIEIILLVSFILFNIIILFICLKKRKFKNISLPFIPFVFIGSLINTIIYIVKK